jgi:hypothetical protein
VGAICVGQMPSKSATVAAMRSGVAAMIRSWLLLMLICGCSAEPVLCCLGSGASATSDCHLMFNSATAARLGCPIPPCSGSLIALLCRGRPDCSTGYDETAPSPVTPLIERVDTPRVPAVPGNPCKYGYRRTALLRHDPLAEPVPLLTHLQGVAHRGGAKRAHRRRRIARRAVPKEQEIMRKVVASEFISLDGVVQAPGDPGGLTPTG